MAKQPTPASAGGYSTGPAPGVGPLGASGASSAPVEPVARESAPREPSPPSVIWRFRSAAPVSGSPAVSPAGLVYAATVEGYVHALEPDGAFRWSYGLVGIPIGAPAVDDMGQVYVATSDQRLYALRPDGHLGWMQTSSTRFATPPIWVPPGFIYYAGHDQNIYSLASWNSAASGHYLGQPVSVPLATVGDGLVAFGTAAPDAQVFRRSSLVARLPLESQLVQPLLGGKTHWFAVTRVGLSAFDVATHALAWTGSARRAALSLDERQLLVEVERELVWLSPVTGQELHRMKLVGDISALPVLTNAGIAVVPMVSGELVVVEPRSGLVARVEVGRAPAWPPVWDERSARITAAAGGALVGLDLSAWSRAFGEHDNPLDAAPGARERGASDASTPASDPAPTGVGVQHVSPERSEQGAPAAGGAG